MTSKPHSSFSEDIATIHRSLQYGLKPLNDESRAALVRIEEQLEAERAAGGEWASIAGEQMARAKTAREVLTDISHLDGNLSARILADRWLDADEQASNPARES